MRDIPSAESSATGRSAEISSSEPPFAHHNGAVTASPRIPFQPAARSYHFGYAIAIFGSALVLFIRGMLLDDLLGDDAPLIPFMLPVAVAAWYGGLRPALLAAALGALASAYYLLAPSGSLYVSDGGDQVRLAMFVAVAALVSWLGGALHAARRAVAAGERWLQQETGERQRLQTALRQSSERLRLAAITARLGSWERDLASGRIDSSAQCMANFGLPENAELNEQTLFDELIHAEDRDRVREKVRLAIVGHTDYDAEYRTIWPDGSVHWIIARGRAVYDANDNPIRMVGVTLDITERRQAEENARRSEQQLKLITDAVPFLISYIDSEQRYRFNNRAYDAWFHQSADDIRGKLVSEVLGEPAYEKLRGHIEAALAGIVTTYEAEVPFKTGGPRWIHSAYTPDIDDQGRVRGIFTSVADITREKQAEAELLESGQRYRQASQELARLNEELEQRVIERTALAEQRAMQLRALTLQLSRAEAQERRRIAHMLQDDLQQLLLSGKFRLEALKKTAPAADIAPIAEMLDRSIVASRSLASELSPPVLYQLNLEAALKWLAEREQEQHGLHVEVKSSGEPIELDEAVKVLLYQAVRELLLNTVKHGGVGAARITLHASADNFMVRVEDKGAGFDPRSLAAGSGLRLKHGLADGAGFGLFGIRERLEALGGKMVVSARPGLGTRIGLVLPMVAARTMIGGSDPPLSRSSPISLLHSSGSGTDAAGIIRVLIADDHQLVREGLRGLIQAEDDMQVVGEAENGEQAVALAASLLPDVILMDINMPITDGVKATRRIKADPAQAHIVIIAVSMHNDEAVMQAMRKAGAADYIAKDRVSGLLCDAIRAHSAKPARPAADAAISA